MSVEGVSRIKRGGGIDERSLFRKQLSVDFEEADISAVSILYMRERVFRKGNTRVSGVCHKDPSQVVLNGLGMALSVY